MHHCDWVPTLVAAAGGTLDDTASPPLDGLNLWPTLTDASKLKGGPRSTVVMNIDPTNQVDENDPGGWSGYAAIRSGDFKLVLGWPGVPDGWCWPNQNKSSGVRGGTPAGEAADPESCAPPPGRKSGADLACKANDLKQLVANASACCAACNADKKCAGFTWNPGEATTHNCWLKTSVATCAARKGSISGACRPPAPTPPAPTPAPYPGAPTCSYTGKVPPLALRTKPMLFDLLHDPSERVDLAAAQPAQVAELRKLLDVYIKSTVTPLNEKSCGKQNTTGCRGTAPAAIAVRNKDNGWMPWADEGGDAEKIWS